MVRARSPRPAPTAARAVRHALSRSAGAVLGRTGRARSSRRTRVAATLVGAVVLAGGLTAYLGTAGPTPDPVLITTADWRGGAAGSSAARRGSPGAWLATGSVPGASTRWEDMAREALLDLYALARPDGAVAAGAADRWTYVWPRDNAFVAVALARSGHLLQAATILDHLAGLPFDDSGAGFEARYLMDGSGAPDERSPQSDGAGWFLWALDTVHTSISAPPMTEAERSMLDRATDLLLGLTDDGRGLPPPSPDYWEVRVADTSLGTAAPLAIGLRAAARTYGRLGDAARAQQAGTAADRLDTAVFVAFGGPWERFGHFGGLDAAVAFRMPPFAEETSDVARAWTRYQGVAVRGGGGLAPGEEWKQDGISWTPETALVAYTAAASGRRDLAAYWLDWLDAHRTTWGSLPEKVTASGQPAGPAPLAWTASLVLLTLAELDVR